MPADSPLFSPDEFAEADLRPRSPGEHASPGSEAGYPSLPLAETGETTPIILPTVDSAGLQPNRPPEGETDRRLYIPFPEGWEARVKIGWEKDYCFAKNPGQDYFHLILNGEVFLQHGTEKYCLNCAIRRGVVTSDRLHWQHLSRKKESMPL